MSNIKKVSGIALATALLSTTALSAEPLTIVSWGGAYSESQNKAYHEPFTAKTGIEIINEDKAANGLAGIRAQVEAGNVTWDVVDALQADAMRMCDEGLILKIDHDKVLAAAPDGTPASEDFLPGTLGDCFIPQIVYSTLFAYNTDAFEGKKAPSSVADIWNTKEFPGTRALQKIPQKNLEWALIADGVAPEDVYDVLGTKEGQDRAFAKLDEIKDSVIWWDQGAQPPQMLADEEAVIATAFNGRIFDAQVNEDQPFELIWDQQMFEVDGWVVPVDTGEEETIFEYLNFATDSQRLADQSKYISYGPARKSSASLVDKHEATGIDMKPHMPTSPENFKVAFAFDPTFWADYGDTLEERFNSWVSQ